VFVILVEIHGDRSEDLFKVQHFILSLVLILD